MPLYHYIKDKDGNSKMEIVSPTLLDEVPLQTPASPVGANKRSGHYTCTLCQPHKAFKTAGVAVIHFNRQHSEHKETDVSWKQHVVKSDDSNG